MSSVVRVAVRTACSAGLVATCLLVACSDDDAPPDGGADASTDAGVDASSSPDGGPAPLPTVLPSGAVLADPIPPAPPQLTPCAMGWREVALGGGDGVVCEPWPEAGRATCAADEAHFPGEPGCSRIGAACTADPWAPDLPTATPVLYVSPTAAPGGDGTRAAPFATIAEATAVATAGTTIALAKGDYDEPVTIAAGVALRGACVAETRLTHGTRTTAPATVTIVGTDAVVSGVTISGARAGLLVDRAASARIEGVVIDRATEAGLRVHLGGVGSLRDVVIRYTQTDPDDGISAFGLVVEYGGNADARRVAVEHVRIGGVLVDGTGAPTRLTLADSVIANILSTETGGMFGSGIGAQRGGEAILDRVVIEDTRAGAVSVPDRSTITMNDCVIRRVTRQARGGYLGSGIVAAGAVVARRTRVEEATDEGAYIVGAGTLQLDDVVIRGTRLPAGSTDGARGIFAEGGGTLEATRTLVDACPDHGILVSNASTARLSDVVVRDIAALRAFELSAGGLYAFAGSNVEIARVRIERSTSAGVQVMDGSRILGSDLDVRDVQPEPEGTGWSGVGLGLLVGGATFEVDRARIERARALALVVADVGYGRTAIATIRDLRIARTLSIERDQPPFMDPATGSPGNLLGRALELGDNGETTIERSILEENRNIAILPSSGARLTLRDAVVRDTQPDEASLRGGRGIEAQSGAQVTIEGVRFERNGDVSVAAYAPGTGIHMSDVAILDTIESVCVATTCVDRAGGIGIGSYGGALVTATRFVVARGALAGVQVGPGSDMVLSSGEVSGSPIGANVQEPSFDLARIQDDVRYVGNGTSLDSRALPLPESSVGFGAM